MRLNPGGAGFEIVPGGTPLRAPLPWSPMVITIDFEKIAVGNKSCSGGAPSEPFPPAQLFIRDGKWSKLNRFERFKALKASERPYLSSYVKKIRGYYHRL